MQDNNNKNKIKIQVAKPKKINKNKIVKATIQGDKYIDIMALDKNNGATVRKLNKDEYVVVSTGEIKKFNKDKTNTEKTITNLRKTFNRLRQLIRTNFTNDSDNQLFITLTYKENMTDETRLYKDFELFYKRLQYRLKGHKLDYISVVEPQGRGAWHIHLMLKSDKPVLYIDKKELTKIWGKGRTDVQRLKSDDVGSYYVAYFTDLQVINNTGLDKTNNKKRIKGARLSMYPKNFKFYRTSRGIKKPDEIYIEYGEIEKQKEFINTYTSAVSIYDEEEEKEINFIQKEVWKRKTKT